MVFIALVAVTPALPPFYVRMFGDKNVSHSNIHSYLERVSGNRLATIGRAIIVLGYMYVCEPRGCLSFYFYIRMLASNSSTGIARKDKLLLSEVYPICSNLLPTSSS